MRPSPKTAAISIGVFITCLFILGAVFISFVQTDHFRAMIVKKINTSMVGNLTIGRHDISFLRGTIVLENLAVVSPSGHPLAILDRLSADIAWLPLLRGRIVVETIRMQHPDIQLTIDKAGNIDLTEVFKASSQSKQAPVQRRSGFPFDIVVRDLLIADGDIHIVAEAHDLQMDLGGMTIQASGNLFKQTGHIRISVAETVLVHEARDLKIHPATLSVVLQENGLVQAAFEVKTDFAEISLDGEVSQVFHAPNLNLRLAFDVSLQDLNRLVTLPQGYSGKAKGMLSVQGNWRDPDADLNLTYNGGLLAGYPVEGLRAGMRLKERKIDVRHLDIIAGSGDIRLNGQINLQDVFPEGLASSPTYPDKVGYRLGASLKHVDVNLIDRDRGRFNGFLNTDTTFEGQGFTFENLSTSATIDALLDSFFMAGMPQPTTFKLNTSATIEAGVIQSNQLTISAAGIQLNARGSVDTASGHIQGQLKAVTENIAGPASLLGLVGNSGSLSARLNVSGPWKRPDIEIEMRGKQITFDPVFLGDVDLSATIDQSGLLNIRSLELVNQDTRGQGNGTMQLFSEPFQLHETMPLKARLTFFNMRPHIFLGEQAVNGNFEGEMQVNGSIDSLEASAILMGKDVTYEKIVLGNVDTRLRFSRGGFHLDQFRLKNQNGLYRLSGDIQVFEPKAWQRLTEPVLNLSLKGEGVTLADYVPDIKGSLNLEAHLEGPVSGLMGQGHIQGKNLDLYGQPVQALTLDLSLNDNRLHIRPLKAFIDPQNLVQGSGWIGFNGQFSLDLHTTGLSLDRIDRIRKMEKIQGKTDVHIRGEGHLKAPSIYGDIYIKEVLINNEKMDDFNFHLALADRKLSIRGQQTFELQADYHLLTKDYAVDLLFTDTDMAPFLLVAGTKDVGGRLSGNILAKGNTASVDKSEVLVDISKISLSYGGETIAFGDRFQGNLKNQSWSIPGFQLNFLQSGQLKIKGAGNFDGHVELTADGGIPAKAAMLFLKDITAVQGDIRIHAEIKGTVAEPELSGEIQLVELGFTLLPIDSSFKNVTGKIQLRPTHLFIEKLTGELDSGLFQTRGELTLENFRPGTLQLEVTSHKIPIHIPETMDVLIDTQLVVGGTMENLAIEGDIVILEGVYYKNIKTNLLQGLKEKRRTEDLPAPKNNYPLVDQITFDIQLKYREPFLVDNNIAYLEIHPDLVLSGTLADPVITGVAKVNNGTLTYQNKAFVVEKGLLNFSNPYRIEPEMDIMGTIRIRQWLISLTMSGTPERLVVELSSTPQEEDADILSLLVFGKTTQEMSDGGNGGVDSTQALLAQVMASSFGTDIKKATGLDYLEVETNAGETATDSDTIQVTVGKDLTERLTVKYTIGSGKDGYHQRTATEYKLIEYILLSGFQDIEGNYGGEIIFRVEFRMFQ
jgi:translocation and assembly module TamB